MITEDQIKTEYPLHWLVWNNQYQLLEKELKKKQHDIEKVDNRGRTPLMLAVTLGHLESSRSLLNHEANSTVENKEGWNVVQEAVSTGDPELLRYVLEKRDIMRFTGRIAAIPDLLQKLKEAPDFYVEMKWEFTSWVPLVSKMCPNDTYKVYKQGSTVRIDTTLLGFDQMKWKRGRRSYIFEGDDDGAVMREVDHEFEHVYTEPVRNTDEAFEAFLPNEETVSQRLTSPIVNTYIDTDKISFERNKTGIWGWGSDKSEEINGHECKVFSASNVELITKTRSEHLTEHDKIRTKNAKTPLQNFLGIADVGAASSTTSEITKEEEFFRNTNPCNITPLEYFDPDFDLDLRDIGRPREVNVKVQKFKANLWLCENYPLSLQEQILPIVDLMAITSSHFAKLRDFIQMQLPSGFPVKIEIPLFHLLNARITFGNIFALDTPVPMVSTIEEDDRLTCVLDEAIFKSPPGYYSYGNDSPNYKRPYYEEDYMLRFAMHQSIVDAENESSKDEVDVWEALRVVQKPPRYDRDNPLVAINIEEQQLQRAIQASLAESQEAGSPSDEDLVENSPNRDLDYNLEMALMMSRKECERAEESRMNDEKMLEEIIELSLREK